MACQTSEGENSQLLSRSNSRSYGTAPTTAHWICSGELEELEPSNWISRSAKGVSRVLPCIEWLSRYKLEYLAGDFMGAANVAAIYGPLSVSFALLGHAPPTSGMLSFIVCPLVYALLGQCPQMIVGPEAPGSLLVGIAVMLTKNSNEDLDSHQTAQLVGAITAASGTIMLLCGTCKLGLLASILNRPLMRGFITALGVGVMIEQAVSGLGLKALARQVGLGSEDSATEKLAFILENITAIHFLTAIVSISTFVLVLVVRSAKRDLKSRLPAMGSFPDRLLVILLAALLTWRFQWQEMGVEILGRSHLVQPPEISFAWPIDSKTTAPILSVLPTCLTLAMTGLFESLLTIRTLRKLSRADASSGNPSRNGVNQELIALGTANVIAGCVNALPSFGGYGRSKLNVSAGGKTPMSNVFLSMLMAGCLFWLLPAFYYVPNCVLAALIAEVGLSMVEECPGDVVFFWSVSAYRELVMIVVVFTASICHSLSAGMAAGVASSLLALIWPCATGRRPLSGFRIGDPKEVLLRMMEPFYDNEKLTAISMSGHLTFANANKMEREIELALSRSDSTHSWSKLQRSHILLIDISDLADIDKCSAHTLMEMMQESASHGVAFWFFSEHSVNITMHLEKLFQQAGILEGKGGQHVKFLTGVNKLRNTLVDV